MWSWNERRDTKRIMPLFSALFMITMITLGHNIIHNDVKMMEIKIIIQVDFLSRVTECEMRLRRRMG